MESLFIWKMDPYDWFCGPGSQLWFDINYINSEHWIMDLCIHLPNMRKLF